jgi:hypothetical protein
MDASDSNLLQFALLDARPRVSGARLGVIVDLGGQPIVDFPGNPFGAQPARVLASVTWRHLRGALERRLPVLLVFEDDDPLAPVIVDVVLDRPEESQQNENGSPFGASRSSDAVRVTQFRDVVACVGTIAGVENEVVLVRSAASPHPIEAKSAVVLRNLKDPVVYLAPEGGAAIIVGQIHPTVTIAPADAAGGDIIVTGHRITMEAASELVLKAGACVVRLDARGKLSATADQIVSRARGANKVQGGSVQLN